MGPSKRLKALQQEKSDLVARMEALLNAADDGHRDLTADEETDYRELEAQLLALGRRIEREETFLNAQASQQPIRDLNRANRSVTPAMFEIWRSPERRDILAVLRSRSFGYHNSWSRRS